MTLEAQIARIALSAVRNRNTSGLRSGLIELTNVAVKRGLIDRVGADALLSLESELEELITEIKILQDIMEEGDEPLTQEVVNLILDPWYLRFCWDLKRAFEHKILNTRYETNTSKVVPFTLSKTKVTTTL